MGADTIRHAVASDCIINTLSGEVHSPVVVVGNVCVGGVVRPPRLGALGVNGGTPGGVRVVMVVVVMMAVGGIVVRSGGGDVR